MKAVWSRKAVQHLVALREYIAKDSEQNATIMATRILDAIDLLQTQPEMGRPGRVVGTRELVIPDTPYIIPYRIRNERLELIAVFHGRQKWPKRLDAITVRRNRQPPTIRSTSLYNSSSLLGASPLFSLNFFVMS